MEITTLDLKDINIRLIKLTNLVLINNSKYSQTKNLIIGMLFILIFFDHTP